MTNTYLMSHVDLVHCNPKPKNSVQSDITGIDKIVIISFHIPRNFLVQIPIPNCGKFTWNAEIFNWLNCRCPNFQSNWTIKVESYKLKITQFSQQILHLRLIHLCKLAQIKKADQYIPFELDNLTQKLGWPRSINKNMWGSEHWNSRQITELQIWGRLIKIALDFEEMRRSM